MILETTDKNSRILLTSELCDPIRELEIKIEYTGQSDLEKALPLDGEIIPHIIKAVNHHDELVNVVASLVRLRDISDVWIPIGWLDEAKAVLAKLEAR